MLSLRPVTGIDAWIAEVRGNTLLHLGHVLMLLSVPLLIVVALTFMRLLRDRGAWLGLVGGVLAIIGAVVLAADKGALSLTISAFDTLPDAQFAQLRPGLIALQERAGWLPLLWLLLLLPLGVALQGVGLLVVRVLPRWQAVLVVVGSLLLLNPDIEIISLAASVLLAIALVPFGLRLMSGAGTHRTLDRCCRRPVGQGNTTTHRRRLRCPCRLRSGSDLHHTIPVLSALICVGGVYWSWM